MELPATIATIVDPLLEKFPPEQSMNELVVRKKTSAQKVDAVERLIDGAGGGLAAPLRSALWLYVDELDRSHSISQGVKDSTGSFWHGIMHRREGDFSNSHYWFNKVGIHPAMAQIEGYDAHEFIDLVEREAGRQDPGLLRLQRLEWQTLFAWCAAEYS